MTRIGRRELLTGATAMSALVVSGCLSRAREELGGQPDSTDAPENPDSTDENGTDSTDENGEESAPDQSVKDADVTDSPGIDGASIETVGSDCGSPDDDGSAVDVAENTVVVDGVLPAPNPCHEAVLTDVALDGETLSVVIDVADTTSEDEGCIMCHGKVEYLAEVDPVDLSEVESVAVTHETGNRHTTEIDPGDVENSNDSEDPDGPDDSDEPDNPDDSEDPDGPDDSDEPDNPDDSEDPDGPDDSEDSDDSGGTSDPDNGNDEGPVEQASIETVDTGCGSGDEAITIDFDDGDVRVTGVVSTPNPCHEAVIGSVTVEGDHLSVVVAPRSTLQEGDVCVQCIGAIEYEARIVPTDASAVETVTVEHASGIGRTARR